MKIGLYECANARGEIDYIYCRKGYRLMGAETLPIIRLIRGTPLECSICQSCPDFDRMGEHLKAEDRGWERREHENLPDN